MTTQRTLQALALAAAVFLAGCATRPATPPASGQTDAAASTDARPAASPAAEEEGPQAQIRPSPTGPGAGIRPYVPMSPLTVRDMQGRPVTPLNAPADIWERVRGNFAMPDLSNDLVRKQEQWYAGRPDYIQRMVERSRMYLFHIVEEAEMRGMPSELALLPYIESAFNPQAVSSAKAAGLWQFMPATGTHFELRQNALRDDRRDIIASTNAALDYLQQLHDKFGDWHLALAAYNWGPGNVANALERNRKAGLGLRYEDLRMPDETRNYVPKLQAVKNIIADPGKFDASLPDIGNHPFFDTVAITRDIDVALAAELAGVRLDDLRALNPGMKRSVIFAQAAEHILLPWENAATFKQNLAAMDPKAPLASHTVWVAPRTMSVAEAAREVGMSEDAFRTLNHIPPHVKVSAGAALLAPRGKGQALAVSASIVNNARVAFTPEVVLRKTVLRARKGDTIDRIARRYDLPPGTVAGWNKTSATASLKAGQSITLYLPMRAGKPKAAPRSKAGARRAAAAQAGKGRVKVTMAPGKAKAGAGKAPAKAPAGKASAAKTKAAAPAKAKARK